MLIRKLDLPDLPAFHDLRVEMCTLHPEAFDQLSDEVAATPERTYTEWISRRDFFPENFVLAAFEDDRLIATVGLHRETTRKMNHRAMIWTVYVRPEARGNGLSRRLMNQVIDESRKMHGLEQLYLEVALTQTGARSLYTSLGFITTGLLLKCYKLPDGHYVDQELMTLWL